MATRTAVGSCLVAVAAHDSAKPSVDPRAAFRAHPLAYQHANLFAEDFDVAPWNLHASPHACPQISEGHELFGSGPPRESRPFEFRPNSCAHQDVFLLLATGSAAILARRAHDNQGQGHEGPRARRRPVATVGPRHGQAILGRRAVRECRLPVVRVHRLQPGRDVARSIVPLVPLVLILQLAALLDHQKRAKERLRLSCALVAAVPQNYRSRFLSWTATAMEVATNAEVLCLQTMAGTEHLVR